MSLSRVSCRFLKNSFGIQNNIRSFGCTNYQAMRFVQYRDGCNRGLGIQLNGGESLVSLSGADPTIPVDMVSFLHSEYSMERIEKLV